MTVCWNGTEKGQNEHVNMLCQKNKNPLKELWQHVKGLGRQLEGTPTD